MEMSVRATVVSVDGLRGCSCQVVTGHNFSLNKASLCRLSLMTCSAWRTLLFAWDYPYRDFPLVGQSLTLCAMMLRPGKRQVVSYSGQHSILEELHLGLFCQHWFKDAIALSVAFSWPLVAALSGGSWLRSSLHVSQTWYLKMSEPTASFFYYALLTVLARPLAALY